jgi:peptidoglycan/LPS O-acetylase OafA/YrhL
VLSGGYLGRARAGRERTRAPEAVCDDVARGRGSVRTVVGAPGGRGGAGAGAAPGASDQPATPTPPGSVVTTHIRGLDGIRALAVIAVLGFHAGVPGFGGGSIGVDMFFVLSGFLITSLLVGEWSGSGRISLRGFYERRARRLLPALMVLMALIVVYAAYFAETDTLSTLRGDAISTLLYVANWRFIFSHQGYFVRYGPPSPLLHTWSLAVEEQFYLIWPGVALLSLKHWGRRGLVGVAVFLAAASAIVTVLLDHAGVSATQLYYGTETRAQEIMIGALLALAGPGLHRWCTGRRAGRRAAGHAAGRTGAAPRRLVVGLAGLAGGAGLVWAVLSLSAQGGFLYNGGFAVIAVATAAVILVVVELPLSPMGRLLGLGPLGYVGRISYGLYLYHFPLFLILNGQRTGMAGADLLGVRIGATAAMAVTSYHLVELPIRNRRRVSLRWLVPGGVVTVASLVTALVLTTVPVTAASPPITAAAKASLTDIPKTPPKGLPDGKLVRAVLFGDSLALTLGVGLGTNAPDWGVDFDNKGIIGCDLDYHSVVNIQGNITTAAPGCVDWPKTWKDYIDTNDPDVVAVELGRWEVSDRIVDGKWTSIGKKPWDDLYSEELSEAIRILSSKGAHVALLTLPYIQQTTDAPNGQPWDINQPIRTNEYNALIRRVAARFPKVVTIIDLNHLLCPKGVYTSYLDGIRVRDVDDEHISPQGGEYLRPVILPELFRLGLSHARARS